MTPSPIGKVLSILRSQRVQALLMGGQACILYGAAEFSRDIDVIVLASELNLVSDSVRHFPNYALSKSSFHPWQPGFAPRPCLSFFAPKSKKPKACASTSAAVMHGCDPFDRLWARRRRLSLPGIGLINVPCRFLTSFRQKKRSVTKIGPWSGGSVEVDYHKATSTPSPIPGQVSGYARRLLRRVY